MLSHLGLDRLLEKLTPPLKDLEYGELPDNNIDGGFLDANLYSMESSCCNDGEEFVGAVLRNYLWLPRLSHAINSSPDNSTLCMVGYGHLVSEHGLLCLLQGKGFTIERMNKNGSYSPLSYKPNPLPDHLKNLVDKALKDYGHLDS